jgi:outer membrane protein OmpA-like peptidoglycan-associated protein
MEVRMIKYLISLVLLSAVVTQAKPNYLPFKPMADRINIPVGNVAGKSKSLPIITWGGDIATIHANGNQAHTKSGSIFAQHGLKYHLEREDVFSRQVEKYISGKTPFLRGTLGMIQTAGTVVANNPSLKPVVFYQMTWSVGGDALVVKTGIKKVSDLKGKTIAVQADGPHVDYIARVLNDAGLTFNDVKVRWLPDLTGSDNSPAAALNESDIDAAFVIIPDALALTSGGNVGTGSEDSVKGAKILMSTKTANRVIADVYAVRSDYYQKNKAEIETLTKALLEAEQSLSAIVKNRLSNEAAYQSVMSASAELLLDSREAIADTEGLYADCEFLGFKGNLNFFANAKYPRRFEQLNKEIAKSFNPLGLATSITLIEKASINYRELETGLASLSTTESSRFNKDKVAAVIAKKQQQNSLSDDAIFSFEVFFKPNQQVFSAELYQNDFDRVADLASVYGGAIITIEGHSDPMGYLKKKKLQESSIVLGRIKQSAKNLSLSRAQSVRDSIIASAKSKGILLDPAQFAIVGHGITQPNTGICGSDPCAPKTEKEWRSNMRVEFRLIQVEAESEVFQAL